MSSEEILVYIEKGRLEYEATINKQKILRSDFQ
jgi:hypothetical protein